MYLRSRQWFLVVAVAGLSAGCGSPPPWSGTPKWSAAKGSCATWLVPAVWKVPRKNQSVWPLSFVVGRFDHYELRRSSSKGLLYMRLFFSGTARGVPDFFSVNAYGLQPGSGSAMREIAEDQWRAATFLPFSKESLVQETETSVIFRGKKFAREGDRRDERAFTTRVSNQFKWLTAFTLSSTAPDDPHLTGVKEPYSGHLYFDVYNLASAGRIVAGEVQFSDGQPHELTEDSGWYGDEYFIIPLDGGKRRFLLCSVPQ